MHRKEEGTCSSVIQQVTAAAAIAGCGGDSAAAETASESACGCPATRPAAAAGAALAPGNAAAPGARPRTRAAAAERIPVLVLIGGQSRHRPHPAAAGCDLQYVCSCAPQRAQHSTLGIPSSAGAPHGTRACAQTRTLLRHEAEHSEIRRRRHLGALLRADLRGGSASPSLPDAPSLSEGTSAARPSCRTPPLPSSASMPCVLSQWNVTSWHVTRSPQWCRESYEKRYKTAGARLTGSASLHHPHRRWHLVRHSWQYHHPLRKQHSISTFPSCVLVRCLHLCGCLAQRQCWLRVHDR